MAPSKTGAAPQVIPLRAPKPIAFCLAVFGMGMVTCVALVGAGRADVLPQSFQAVTQQYFIPLSLMLFGASWPAITQGLACLAWLAHVFETAYVLYRLASASSSGAATVSAGAMIGYAVGVFFGGFTHGAVALAAVGRAENAKQKRS
jgi:hypothetical protein